MFTSDLKGNYQTKNIKVVLAIIRHLQNEVMISTKNSEQGLLNVQKNTNFIGRWYEFSADLNNCDTGINQAGLKRFLRN